MIQTPDTPPPAPTWSAEELHALADEIATLDAAGLSSVLLDQLEALERVKCAAAAAQVRVTAAFADAAEVVEDDPTEGRRRARRTLSIGAEVALAARTSPYQGEQRVLLSRRLRDDLPGVHAALGRGDIREDQAYAVAREVAHLEPAQRATVDADLTGDPAALAGVGDEKLRRAVRRACLTVAADAETRRHLRARADRHVTTRQLDDGTGRITAVVAVEHLAAVRTVLDQAAATARAAGDERTGGQVRSDALVHRITGHDPVVPVPVRVNLVVSAESLLGTDDQPAQVAGIGWLPAGLCTRLVREASSTAKATLRRLFVRPREGDLVALESRSRVFPPALAELIDLRDGGLCRTPGCNTAIRHHDHVVRESDGGPTSARNGQGLCERCNYAKEAPGWTSWVATPDTGPHEVHGVTEHLRLHRSTAPPPPGCRPPDLSPAELRLAQELTLAA
ncbi:HNH endonuclease [Nocardioides flavus (ex Wang et al. 2016)]|uniref:HNH endonuclease n=1 Tax=Nocardioides flavus (ex Wang et al. 2016) TaxID=2058780 RepID=A0ABQ3HSA7_9ACTN|nr:HNH endonuclease signature motif containing protein [Nocardioides flavus (ex Wang et al. 2016)]GHE19049.1 HNH endonuclease [Nocardioides flavus (ex Wang et al. 2016)]